MHLPLALSHMLRGCSRSGPVLLALFEQHGQAPSFRSGVGRSNSWDSVVSLLPGPSASLRAVNFLNMGSSSTMPCEPWKWAMWASQASLTAQSGLAILACVASASGELRKRWQQSCQLAHRCPGTACAASCLGLGAVESPACSSIGFVSWKALRRPDIVDVALVERGLG